MTRFLQIFYSKYCYVYQSKVVILDYDLARFLVLDVTDITAEFLQMPMALRRWYDVLLTPRERVWLMADRPDLKGYRPRIIEDIGLLKLLPALDTPKAHRLHTDLKGYILGSLRTNGGCSML
ncbi:MAG: hypothetical protein ACO3K7_03745 [Candidatus Marinamargulisbacteria bacterium]